VVAENHGQDALFFLLGRALGGADAHGKGEGLQFGGAEGAFEQIKLVARDGKQGGEFLAVGGLERERVMKRDS